MEDLRIGFGAAVAATDAFDLKTNLGPVIKAFDVGPFGVAEIYVYDAMKGVIS